MNFITPIPMLIAAGLAVPVLLALYFLKLRRRPVRVSSTMLWEDAARDLEVNVPIRWIKSSWLLWVHLLILALLLLALGRPTLETSGPRPARVVLVIDRSASMNAIEFGGQTRLEAAIERAKDIIDDSTARGIEVAILAMDTQPTLVGPASTSRIELNRQLDTIAPSDKPGNPQRAFDYAQTLAVRAAQETESSVPSTVVFLSDGGDTVGAQLTLAGAQFRYEQIGTADHPESLDNLGIVALSARRDRADPRLVRVFFRLTNTGASEVAVPISIETNRESLRRFALTVPASKSGKPGELTRTVELMLDQSEVITVRLEREDALGADNAAGLEIPRPESPALLLVVPTDETGELDPSPILTDMLGALEPRVLRTVPFDTYVHNAENPGDADIIVFDRVAPAAPPRRPSISFGVVPGYLGAVKPGSEIKASTHAVSWDRTHPVLRDVALESLVVSERVALPQSTSAAVERVDTLVSGQAHPLILGYRANGLDHLAVAFAPRNSNWPIQIGFAIFMAQTMEYLAPIGGGAAGRAHTTAEPLRLRASTGSESVTLTGPESRSARVSGGVANLSLPRLVGLYQAEGATIGEIPVSLLNPVESSLRTAPAVAIAGRSVAASAEADLGPTEIWRWLVLGALVLLAVDWVLFGLQMRVGRVTATDFD